MLGGEFGEVFFDVDGVVDAFRRLDGVVGLEADHVFHLTEFVALGGIVFQDEETFLTGKQLGAEVAVNFRDIVVSFVELDGDGLGPEVADIERVVDRCGVQQIVSDVGL